MMSSMVEDEEVQIPIGAATLAGTLKVPSGSRDLVVFAHGSGSSRHSTRNHFVACALQGAGLGTLLFDLLTTREEQIDLLTRHLRFDIDLLAQRMVAVTDWLTSQPATQTRRIGYFGASTGAAAALVAAAARPEQIAAVVSRGGRPDLAGFALARVRVPTLLIVGGKDEGVIDLNQMAYDQLQTKKELAFVSGATYLFEKPSALETVAQLASDWFRRFLINKQTTARDDAE